MSELLWHLNIINLDNKKIGNNSTTLTTVIAPWLCFRTLRAFVTKGSRDLVNVKCFALVKRSCHELVPLLQEGIFSCIPWRESAGPSACYPAISSPLRGSWSSTFSPSPSFQQNRNEKQCSSQVLNWPNSSLPSKTLRATTQTSIDRNILTPCVENRWHNGYPFLFTGYNWHQSQQSVSSL